MNSNLYFIIGAVVLLFVIYLIVLKVWVNRRKEKHFAELNKGHNKNPLTEEQKQMLAFGAILFYYRQEKILDISPDRLPDEYVMGLKQQWEIASDIDAKEVLATLLNLQKSRMFDEALNSSPDDIEGMQRQIASGLGIDIGKVSQAQSTYAWDLCRAASLAKWCYWCGYLNENEFWEVLRQVREKAMTLGTDWTDYTVSFLLGRTHQGFDLDDVIIEAKQLLNGKGPSLRKITDIDVYQQYPLKP